MHLVTTEKNDGSDNGDNPTAQLSDKGFAILADIRDEMTRRFQFHYGLEVEDSKDLAGDLAARCCVSGIAWLCSKRERSLLTSGRLKIGEEIILRRLLRPRFLARKSIDFVRKDNAAMRDTRLTESLDQSEEVDGEEIPSIQITYDEVQKRDPLHQLEATDELEHLARTVIPDLSKSKKRIFVGALNHPESLFHSADLALILTGNDDAKSRKRIAARTGEVKDEIRLLYRLHSGNSRPLFA